MFDDCHYHKIFGCPMGSPVSAVIAINQEKLH
jgi:hypothetical protein